MILCPACASRSRTRRSLRPRWTISAIEEGCLDCVSGKVDSPAARPQIAALGHGPAASAAAPGAINPAMASSPRQSSADRNGELSLSPVALRHQLRYRPKARSHSAFGSGSQARNRPPGASIPASRDRAAGSRRRRTQELTAAITSKRLPSRSLSESSGDQRIAAVPATGGSIDASRATCSASGWLAV